MEDKIQIIMPAFDLAMCTIAYDEDNGDSISIYRNNKEYNLYIAYMQDGSRHVKNFNIPKNLALKLKGNKKWCFR